MAAPGYFVGGYYGDAYVAADMENNNNNQLAIDELLDFSNEDEVLTDAFFENIAGNSNDSSTVTAVDSCNSSVSGGEQQFLGGNVGCRSFSDAQFSGELCVPYDDLAELEWLSNFVEDSFSSDNLHHHHHFITATATATSSLQTPSFPTHHQAPPPFFPSDVSVPGKARSKRSRAAPCDWSSRLLVVSPKTTLPAKNNRDDDDNNPTRKCLHCGSDKTPQWRTGPMGPKTLCNACGVRFKSGRLVPEYRPAASPTFVSTKHSNSHRKVLELRRQKEMHRQHQFVGNTNAIFGDDYLISRNCGPEYGHMI